MSHTTEKLIDRARRFHSRGEDRKALVALREACLRDDRAAWVWTLYGVWLSERGNIQEAERVLLHALWLRRQAKDEGRTRSTEQLLSQIRMAA